MKTLETLLHSQLRLPYFRELELETLLDGSPNSRYGKVKRLLAQHRLIHIRRGLYYLKDHPLKPHPFELAQWIYGPSYISLESALAYRQLIPEVVYTITSVCIRRAKEFHTPLGAFSYLHLPLENFYIDVELITEQNYHFFMAKPWKAICDYIYCYKKNWRGLAPLLDSLRISREDLPDLSDTEIAALDEYYHRKNISLFLKNVVREMQS